MSEMQLKPKRLLRINRTYYEIKDGSMNIVDKPYSYELDRVKRGDKRSLEVELELEKLTDKQTTAIVRQFKRHRTKHFTVGVWRKTGRKHAQEEFVTNLHLTTYVFNRPRREVSALFKLAA